MPDHTEITPSARIATATHGWRAKCLQRLVRLDLPVPTTVALSFAAVRAIASGTPAPGKAILSAFPAAPLVSIRPSPENPDWGGPGTLLNIGLNAARHAALAASHGHEVADALYLRFVQAYAIHVARLDPDMFDAAAPSAEALRAALRAYEQETDEPFPQDPAVQLTQALRSMARAWEGTTARLLRQAKGAPHDASLGLVVQEMALGMGHGVSGSGVIQFVDAATGLPQVTGRYLSQSLGRDALARAAEGTIYLARDPRGPALEDLAPEAFAALIRHGAACRARLREEMQIEFTLEGGALRVLDAVKVARTSRATLKIAVALAEDGIIGKDDAVLRVEPRALSELLHPQVDPRGARDVLVRGIAASPGAAVGRLVFSSAAHRPVRRAGRSCILVRRETSPEDIRGMHAAQGVLTERGGMTSHAAVIARGLGLPCVVGASDLRLDSRDKRIVTADGRVFREGDLITLDGTAGEALAGPPTCWPRRWTTISQVPVLGRYVPRHRRARQCRHARRRAGRPRLCRRRHRAVPHRTHVL
jgi:pyruvate, orthophosphate dikinase